MFFRVNRKWSVPVNTSSDWLCSGLQRNHDVSSKTTGLWTNVLSTEVKFAQFVAEHNLPFSVADHFTKLAKQLFLDSDITGKFSSGRTKTTMMLKNALAPRLDANVVKLCQNNRFSLLIDESNEQGGEKTLVKVFDPEIATAVTRFVDIPVCNIGTGAHIFSSRPRLRHGIT